MNSVSEMSARERQQFFERLRKQNPKPETELEYTSPYEMLIAVMLSAQATDVSVNKVTRHLFRIASTPQAMVALGVEHVETFVRSIGLFRTKAKNVVATSQLLIERHNGRVPTDRESLEALPGVGRKTANVVLNNVFGDPTIAVDTHVFRVSNRTGLAPGADVAHVEQQLLDNTPPEFLADCHHWLILHGRYTCKARVPECWRCVVVDLCHFDAKVLEPPPGATRE
jgi:endonuclease III